METKTKFELDPNDAAVIWRGTGGLELILPNQDQDAPMDGPATTAAAVAMVFGDSSRRANEIRQSIYDFLEDRTHE